MRPTTRVLVLVGAALLGACATDPYDRLPTGPLYSLRMLESGPTEVSVSAAALPAAGRPAGEPPLGDPVVLPPPGLPDPVRLYTIEVRFLRVGGPREVLSAPRLTVFPNQRANISIVNQTAFVQDFDAELVDGDVIMDPIIGILQDGLTLDFVAAPVAGTERAVDVAFRLLVADLERPNRLRRLRLAPPAADGTIELPRMAVDSVCGVHRVGIGQEVALAELMGRNGRGAAVWMRIVPTYVSAGGLDVPGAAEIPLTEVEDFAAPELPGGGESEVDLKAMLETARSRGRAGGRLSLEPVTVAGDMDLAAAVAAAPAAGAVGLGGMSLLTNPTPGASLSAQLQESFVADYDVVVAKGGGTVADPVIDTVRSGITGTVLDDGRLRIEWTTTPDVAVFGTQLVRGLQVDVDVPEHCAHTVTVPLAEGRQLVPVARLADGRTAAVWVGFTIE